MCRSMFDKNRLKNKNKKPERERNKRDEWSIKLVSYQIVYIKVNIWLLLVLTLLKFIVIDLAIFCHRVFAISNEIVLLLNDCNDFLCCCCCCCYLICLVIRRLDRNHYNNPNKYKTSLSIPISLLAIIVCVYNNNNNTNDELNKIFSFFLF